MSQFIYSSIPGVLNRYFAINALRQLQDGDRLIFNDEKAYVLRKEAHYVAYCAWMSIMPLIEIFEPGQEASIIEWLEQFDYFSEATSHPGSTQRAIDRSQRFLMAYHFNQSS
jgi:hypothetical protein